MTAAIQPGLYRHSKSGGLYRVLGVARRVKVDFDEVAAVVISEGRDATDPNDGVQGLFPPRVHIGLTRSGELLSWSDAWKDPDGQAVVYVSAEDGRWWVRDLAQFTERVSVNERERGFEVRQRFEWVGP